MAPFLAVRRKIIYQSTRTSLLLRYVFIRRSPDQPVISVPVGQRPNKGMSRLFPWRCVAVGEFSSAARLREARLFQKAGLLVCDSPGFLLSDASACAAAHSLQPPPPQSCLDFRPATRHLSCDRPSTPADSNPVSTSTRAGSEPYGNMRIAKTRRLRAERFYPRGMI